MISLSDIRSIASSVDAEMLRIHSAGGADCRGMVTVRLDVPYVDYAAIDEALYLNENGTMAGYTMSGEIDVSVIGIHFHIARSGGAT